MVLLFTARILIAALTFGGIAAAHAASGGTSTTLAEQYLLSAANQERAALGCAYAAEHGVALGTINSNTFQDDDYKLGSLTHTDKAVRQKAIDHHLGCIEIMDADRVTGPEDLAGGRHELPRPGRHPRPAGPAGRVAGRDLPAHRRRPANGVGVQVLRARDLHDRRAGLGYVLRPGLRPRRARDGLPGHRPPRAGHQHRVHRRCSCCAWGSSARSTSTPASTPTTT